MTENVAVGAAPASARKGVEWLARFGYAAKGVVYATVGLLAFEAAFAGGDTADAEEAIREIGHQPFGQVLLAVMAAGLAGYSLWRLVQAIKDPEGRGTDGEGIVQRIGLFGSAVIHASLVVFTLKLLTGDGGGGTSTQSKTAELMSQPWGKWLVAIVGLVTLGVGIFQFVRAAKGSFTKRWKIGEMSARARTWAKRSGYLGLTARGVVFSIIGWFFLRAAWKAQPGEARGLDGALATVAAQPYGPWLLGLVAVGLMAYGVYCWVQARYRRISP